MLDENISDYNCIAWAMGFTNRWVGGLNPYQLSHGELPPPWYDSSKIVPPGSPDILVHAFRNEEFEETKNPNYEKGYNKVALYQRRNRFSCNYTWTHAARIVSDDVEHSKLGHSFNVAHSRNQFSKTILSTYFLWRKRNGRCVSNDFLNLLIDVISDVFLLIVDLIRCFKSTRNDYGEVFTYMKKVDPDERFRKDYIRMCEAQGINMGEINKERPLE